LRLKFHQIIKVNNVEYSSKAISKWFECYEKLGESSDIGFNIEAIESASPFLHFKGHVSHIRGDGSSALFELSKKMNFDLTHVSTKTPLSRTSLTTYIKQIFLFFYYARKRTVNIWMKNHTSANQPQSLQNTAEVKFTYEEFYQLKKKLAENQLSLNAFLITTLDQTIREYFNIKSETAWWIPVNFRAELGIDNNDKTINGNLVSNFTLEIKENDTPHIVKQKISLALKQKRHWGVWFWQKIPHYLPEKIILKIAQHQISDNYYLGTFTNLGSWSSSSEFNKFYIYATTLKSHPIGASAIVVNDELYIALNINTSLNLSSNDISNIFEIWNLKIRN